MRLICNKKSNSSGDKGHNSCWKLSIVSFERPAAKTAGKANRAPHKPHKNKCVKSVRFSECIDLCDRMPANQEHSKECWYSQQELIELQFPIIWLAQKLKSNTHELYDRNYISALHDMCQTCSQVHDERLLEAGLLKRAEQDHLIQGLIHSNTVGLERSVLEFLAVNYLVRRKNTWKILNQLQTDLPPSDLKVEAIRRTMEPLSLPSRLFAREMGRALRSACGRIG